MSNNSELPPLRGYLPPAPVPYNPPEQQHQPLPPQPTYLPTAQHPVPVVIQVQSAPKIKHNYRARSSKILGIIQIVAAIVGMIGGAIGIWIQVEGENSSYNYYYYYYYSGYWNFSAGYFIAPVFWCGLIFLLSGTVAICAANSKSRCTITHMVLAILSSIGGFNTMACGVYVLVKDSRRLQDGLEDRDYWPRDYHDSGPWEYKVQEDQPYYTDSDKLSSLAKGSVALAVSFVLVGLVEFVTSVWIATLCCRVTCCSNEEGCVSPPVMTSVPGYGQNHVIILDNQGHPVQGAQVLQVPATRTDRWPEQMRAQVLPQKGNSSPPPPY